MVQSERGYESLLPIPLCSAATKDSSNQMAGSVSRGSAGSAAFSTSTAQNTPSAQKRLQIKIWRFREEKSVHDHHRKKMFGELLWPQRKTFQAGGGYKNPIKTRKIISTTEIFPLWPPLFSAKNSSALEQGGICSLFPRDFISLSLS